MVIDYKPGAGASTGTIHVTRAAPDGYTLLYVTAALTVYPAFCPPDKLPYDPVKDLAPVSLITRRSTMLLVHPSLGVSTLGDFVKLARAKPQLGRTVGAGGPQLRFGQRTDSAELPMRGIANGVVLVIQ